MGVRFFCFRGGLNFFAGREGGGEDEEDDDEGGMIVVSVEENHQQREQQQPERGQLCYCKRLSLCFDVWRVYQICRGKWNIDACR